MGRGNLQLVKGSATERDGRKGQRSHKPEAFGSRVFKKSKSYHVDLRWRDAGRPVLRDPAAPGWPERGPTTTVKSTARRWADEYDRRWREEEARKEERRTGAYRSMRAALEPFIRHRSAQGASSTASGSRTAVRHLMEAVGEEADPAAITSAELQELCDDFLAARYEVSTVSNTRNHLRRFFHFLNIEPNPALKVVLPKTGEMEVEPWTDEQRKRIYAAASELDREAGGEDNFYRRLVAYLFSIGPRIQEAAAARWEDINEASRTARISRQIDRETNDIRPTKGKKPRSTVVLHEWWPFHRTGETGLIFPGREGRPIPYRTLYGYVREVLERAGLKRPREAAHQFRHTYAYEFLKLYPNIKALSESLGHKKLATTERYYYHFTSEDAAGAAVRRIYGDRASIRRGPRQKK